MSAGTGASAPVDSPTAATLAGAFVAGATGYVGRALVRQLGAAGLRPVAHVRPDSPRLAEWRSRFEAFGAEVDATPWTEDALAGTLARQRPPAVFALLGTTRRRGAVTGDTYEGVDYGLTAMLLRAVRRSADAGAPLPRVVYLSALGAAAGARNPYLAVRGRLEAELAAGGVPYVVARPSFITGPDRDESRPAERVGAVVVDALVAPVRLLGGLLPGGRRLADRYRSTTAAELAAALVRLAADPAAAGRVVEGDALRG